MTPTLRRIAHAQPVPEPVRHPINIGWFAMVKTFSHVLVVVLYALAASAAHAEPFVPPSSATATAKPAASAPVTNPGYPPSRMQCSPVTPETKVPWIEVSQLPDLTRDFAYFEACSDLDYAWTTQSYPNPKYVPSRTPEHVARVSLLLQGIKDYVSAESDDWVAYVNAWLGATLPPSKIDSRTFPTGGSSVWRFSEGKGQLLTKFLNNTNILGVYGTQSVSAQGAMSYKRTLDIIGIETSKLCVTSIDLQKAFENQSGYLFQPASVRTAPSRPTPQELTKLGGQWFGYQVHVFSGPNTGKYAGLMRVGFWFKPCAASIQIDLTESRS